MEILKVVAILAYVLVLGGLYWRYMQSLIRRDNKYWPVYQGEDIQTIFGKNGANPVFPKRPKANHA
jgi:hypothetical protein